MIDAALWFGISEARGALNVALRGHPRPATVTVQSDISCIPPLATAESLAHRRNPTLGIWPTNGKAGGAPLLMRMPRARDISARLLEFQKTAEGFVLMAVNVTW